MRDDAVLARIIRRIGIQKECLAAYMTHAIVIIHGGCHAVNALLGELTARIVAAAGSDRGVAQRGGGDFRHDLPEAVAEALAEQGGAIPDALAQAAFLHPVDVALLALRAAGLGDGVAIGIVSRDAGGR